MAKKPTFGPYPNLPPGVDGPHNGGPTFPPNTNLPPGVDGLHGGGTIVDSKGGTGFGPKTPEGVVDTVVPGGNGWGVTGTKGTPPKQGGKPTFPPKTNLPPGVDGMHSSSPVDKQETQRLANTGVRKQIKTGSLNQELDPMSTIQGQMQGLLSSNNPLGQMAETQMKQNYNSRGLLNSGKAAKDMMLAKWQALTPIAQQDAQTNFQQDLTNQAYQAQNYFKEVDFQNQKAFSAIQQNFQKELTQIGYNNQMQSILLGAMNTMMNNNNALLGKLAASPDVTDAEYSKVRDSIINSMQTFTNIWSVSANSDDTFDFSGIA